MFGLKDICIDALYTGQVDSPSEEFDSEWTSRVVRDGWAEAKADPKVALLDKTTHIFGVKILENCRLLTHDNAGKIHIWKLETMEKAATLEGHSAAVVASATQSNIAVTSSADKTVRIWDLETSVCTHTIRFDCGLGDLSASEATWTVVGEDHQLHFIDARIKAAAQAAVNVGRPMFSLVEREQILYAGGYTQGVVRVDKRTMQTLSPLSHESTISRLAVTERFLVSAGTDTTIRVWNLVDDSQITTWKKPFYATALKTIEGERLMVSGHSDGSLSMWDPISGKKLRERDPQASGFSVTSLDLDAQFLATGGQGGHIHVYRQ